MGAHALGIALVLRGAGLILNLATGRVLPAANARSDEVVRLRAAVPVVIDLSEFNRLSAAFYKVLKVRHLPAPFRFSMEPIRP